MSSFRDLYQRGSTLPNLSSHTKQGEVKFTLRELFRTPVKRVVRALMPEDRAGPSTAVKVASAPGVAGANFGSIVARIAPVVDTHGCAPRCFGLQSGTTSSPPQFHNNNNHIPRFHTASLPWFYSGRRRYCEIAVCAERLGAVTARAMCNTFLAVSRFSFGQFETVARSELIRNSIAPRYPRFEVSNHRLCFNDSETYLRFEIYNEQKEVRSAPHSSLLAPRSSLLAPRSSLLTPHWLLLCCASTLIGHRGAAPGEPRLPRR
eukprot:SAG31_NODE_13439_length_869_cov_1.172727_1_plen_261_part_01